MREASSVFDHKKNTQLIKIRIIELNLNRFGIIFYLFFLCLIEIFDSDIFSSPYNHLDTGLLFGSFFFLRHNLAVEPFFVLFLYRSDERIKCLLKIAVKVVVEKQMVLLSHRRWKTMKERHSYFLLSTCKILILDSLSLVTLFVLCVCWSAIYVWSLLQITTL